MRVSTGPYNPSPLPPSLIKAIFALVPQFHTDGYLVIPNFFDQPQADELLDRARFLLDDFSLQGHPMTRFTTEGEHVGDNYFLESGDKVRFFFEDGAFDETGKSSSSSRVMDNLRSDIFLSPLRQTVRLSLDRTPVWDAFIGLARRQTHSYCRLAQSLSG